MVHIDKLKDTWLKVKGLVEDLELLGQEIDCLIQDIEKEGVETGS